MKSIKKHKGTSVPKPAEETEARSFLATGGVRPGSSMPGGSARPPPAFSPSALQGPRLRNEKGAAGAGGRRACPDPGVRNERRERQSGNGRAGTALCPPSEPFPAPERVSVQDDDQPGICYGTQGDLKIHSRLELGFERPLMGFLVYAKNHIRFSKCCMYMELFLGNRTTVKNKTFSDLSA